MRLFKSRVIFIPKSFFIWFIIVLVSIMLMAQLILTTPEGRMVLSPVDDTDAISVINENYSSRLGEMSLKLTGTNPSQNIRVLQNGTVIAVFLEKEIKIVVSDNSLIEIDATDTNQSFSVEITKQSDGLELKNCTNPLYLDKNIGILARVFVK